MNCEIFYAKSRNYNGVQKTVAEHLEEVAEKAREFGEEINRGAEAELCGKLHDFGKYSEAFQDVLHGTRQNVDHAVCGAAFLNRKKKEKPAYTPIIEAINGHHSALQDYKLLKELFDYNTKHIEPVVTRDGKTSALAGEEQYEDAQKQFQSDFPNWKIPSLKRFRPEIGGDMNAAQYASNLQTMLYSRMLFSCLVDADYSVSARDNNPDYFDQSEQTEFVPEEVLERLYQFRERIRQSSDAHPKVNELRDELFEQCGKMGMLPEGLFSLTAPTGTGKTLALFHFALKHCIATGKKRIIIVLPFLTLTEQNAAIYRQIVPELLEDHSQSDLDDDSREFSERWRVPVIVTTSVRFFETLFAHRPGDCRKLHNIANSVVVFDEAQSLPVGLITASLQAVNELCRSYHTTMVFSTATQPDFDVLPTVSWKPTEIMPNNARMYQTLKRTQVEWRIGKEKRISLEDIAEEMLEQRSVCTIVNLRKHARKLYHLLKERCAEDELFFLTTDLCTAHRRQLVEEINNRLEHQLPCRVVATQCIEAGVDFDFDVLYRALAPLESIIQAAGRCNRNGRLPDGGRVVVFVPKEEEPLYPGKWYETAALAVDLLHDRHPIDIHDPAHSKEYYELLFQEKGAKDKDTLTQAIQGRNFEETDREYKLIESEGLRVIVPFIGMKERYQTICAQAQESGITPDLIQQAAPITVTAGISQKQKLEEVAEVLYYPKRRESFPRKSEFYVLRSQYLNLYTEKMGLQLPEQIEHQAIW